MAHEVHIRRAEEAGLKSWNLLPAMSSSERTITQDQGFGILVSIIVVLICGVLFPLKVLMVFVAAAMALYTVSLAVRSFIVYRGVSGLTEVSDEEARTLDEDELPIYTVLLPVFREQEEVLAQLVNAMRALDYPEDLLDIKFLVESSDWQTLDILRRQDLEDCFETVVVGKFGPQTKPKACNIGLSLARGEFLVIYDVEDQPDPLQLRKVVAAVRAAHGAGRPEVMGAQCKLQYRNAYMTPPALWPMTWKNVRQRLNPLPKWMDAEYLAHFNQVIPGLARLGLIVPLGGTSNHFLTDRLRQIGGWDAYNVAEDQELSVRVARNGYKILAVDSTTWELANETWRNWWVQRPRWKKGGMQTYLVHMRAPLALWRDLGTVGFLSFQTVIGLPLLTLLLNPFFWALSLVYFVTGAPFIHSLYPLPVLYLGSINMWVGNVVFVAFLLVATVSHGKSGSSPWVLLSPLNWAMLSGAVWIALWELIFRPHYWRKSDHQVLTGRTELPRIGPRPLIHKEAA